jgi:hypothetical protein
MPDAWVNTNIDRNFINFLKENAKAQKFCWIPAGDSKPEKMDAIKYDSKLPIIQFNQGDRNTCATSSLASCLYSLGQASIASSIEEYGQRYTKDLSNDPSRIMPALFDYLQQNVVEFNKRWLPQKLDADNFDLWNDAFIEHPKLLQPIGSDGGVGHAVTVMNRLIFDSNLKHALPLNVQNLEFCIGAVYLGILSGYELVPVPERDPSATKRKKQIDRKRKTKKRLIDSTEMNLIHGKNRMQKKRKKKKTNVDNTEMPFPESCA